MTGDNSRPTKFDVNDPEKQFPIGCAGVYDANGKRLSPVVSCDTATGEVVQLKVTPEGKYVIGGDGLVERVAGFHPAPLEVRVFPTSVELQYRTACAKMMEFQQSPADPVEAGCEHLAALNEIDKDNYLAAAGVTL